MSGAIHFILQGKGGVGKSLVSAMLAQYLQKREVPLYCADTDPVNMTFSRYPSFKVDRIQLMTEDSKLDTRRFDQLIDKLVQHDGNAVIDNGAASFVPLTGYLAESRMFDALQEEGKTVYLHTVLTGGQAMTDTITGLQTLADTQSQPIIVWENEFFGKVVHAGKRFTESDLFKESSSRIHGLVQLEDRTHNTYGVDMEILASNHLTFEQAKSSGKFSFASQHRLRQINKDIFEQLDRLAI